MDENHSGSRSSSISGDPPPAVGSNRNSTSGDSSVIEHPHNLSINGGDTPDGPSSSSGGASTSSGGGGASGAVPKRTASAAAAAAAKLNTEGLAPGWTMQVRIIRFNNLGFF